METSAKSATNVNGARSMLGLWLCSISHAGQRASAELFHEIARKLPKTTPAAPSAGLVLTEKAPAKKKSACC